MFRHAQDIVGENHQVGQLTGLDLRKSRLAVNPATGRRALAYGGRAHMMVDSQNRVMVRIVLDGSVTISRLRSCARACRARSLTDCPRTFGPARQSLGEWVLALAVVAPAASSDPPTVARRWLRWRASALRCDADRLHWRAATTATTRPPDTARPKTR